MSVNHVARRSRRDPWRCWAKGTTHNEFYSELYYHECTLEKDHYGKHKCWCETTFGEPDLNHRQLRLVPFEWDDWNGIRADL